MRVEVRPELLRWALERAGLKTGALAERFPKLAAWLSGAEFPTLKQVEQFANAVHVPLGYLFLQTPPVERIPLPDFRTVSSEHVTQPSPDLLETIYHCQQRQDWYREFMQFSGEEPLSFVGSMTVKTDIEVAARSIRAALKFDLEERHNFSTWEEALRRFIDQADSLGILVMVNGIVGSNTRRKLKPEEFRGFALVDDLAPVVFINGADTKAAQMFTLAHELAHVWLGASAISDVTVISSPANEIEKWCNQVAAEILAPLDLIRKEYRKSASLRGELDRLARRFKISTLVVLRRIYDAAGITRDAFWTAYEREMERLRSILKDRDGGNFYPTHALRVGRRFARALIASTMEGQTLYRDAFRMLGISKLSTFNEIGRNLMVA